MNLAVLDKVLSYGLKSSEISPVATSHKDILVFIMHTISSLGLIFRLDSALNADTDRMNVIRISFFIYPF